jgi:single-strand DNA-binding protein
MNLNHLVISGNLTRDPEIRTVGADKAVASFTIAHNTKYKGQDGELKEEVTFLDCEAWGRQGEIAAQYLQKGSQTLVEGSLKQDAWTDKDGQKRSKFKVRVDRVHLFPMGRRDNSADASEAEASMTRTPQHEEPRQPVRSTSPRSGAASRPVHRASAVVTTEDPPF